MDSGKPSVTGDNLFLIQTAYHVLLAIGLAEQLRSAGQGESTLLFIEDFWNAPEFLAAIRDWPGNPFARLVTLGAYRRYHGRRSKRASVRALSQAISAQLRERPVRALYVFNDRNIFAQCTLRDVARLYPDAARIAVEDGSAAYSDARYRRYNRWRALLHRWRYGPQWHNLEVLGTHPLVQRFIGHYPQAFRPELAARPHERYPGEVLAQLPLEDFARRLGLRLGIDATSWQAADVLLPAPGDYVFDFNPDYPQRMRAVVGALVDAGLRVGLKYHPREQVPDYLGLTQQPNVIELPRAIPVECMYLLFDAQRRIVLGDISSAIMMADKFNPSLRPVVFRHGAGFHDYNLTARFARLSIAAVEDAAQLVTLARAWTART